MEYMTKPQEREKNPSPTSSPNTSTTTTANGGLNTGSNGGGGQIPTPPLTPKPTTPRSDPSPYPTTFVQADTSNFKQVVQMLTGSSETFKQTPSRQSQIPPKRQGFKLYERRNSSNNLKNSLMINTLIPNFNGSGFSPRNKPEILSPSLLNFPSLTLSPVTPLPTNNDVFVAEAMMGNNNSLSSPSCSSSLSSSEEERAIAEKGFYLHPKSPMSSSSATPRDAEPPQLLPLFPVTSPRVSGSAASS